ncbi:MAG: hypothetical protein ACRELU_14490 [Gemmatimonadota bacterium]
MKAKRAWRKSAVTLVAMAGLFPCGALAQEPRAAVVRQPQRAVAAPKIPVIRGEGAAAPQEDLVDAGGVPPRELTVQEKNAFLSGIMYVVLDVGPWRVSPDAPILEGRADLAYLGSFIVDLTTYDAPAAYFLSKSTWTSSSPGLMPTLKLRFQPPGPGNYLVDCRVRNNGESYEVQVHPGGWNQTFAGTEHLVVLYQAVDTSPARFSITANHPEHKAWKFYSCEITPLK